MLQEVALGTSDGNELQAVVPGLLLGEFAGPGPVDTAQVSMDDDQARAGYAGVISLLDNVVQHRLAVFSRGRVEHDPIVAGETGIHVGLRDMN
jgi:hypothetical protein